MKYVLTNVELQIAINACLNFLVEENRSMEAQRKIVHPYLDKLRQIQVYRAEQVIHREKVDGSADIERIEL